MSKKILIIPAAGIGSRMKLEIPKQYVKLKNNKTVLDNTISVFLQNNFIDEIIISLNPNDNFWKNSIYKNHPKIKTCIGGISRFESVFNALNVLNNIKNENPWIFVHDSARPCINLNDVYNLFDNVKNSSQKAGILAIKAFETVKKVNNNNIEKTIDRSNIWLAQTPQLTTFNNLYKAFNYAKNNNLSDKVTDESTALEFININPIIVEGSRKNIKITQQEDLDFVNISI